ncbi:hypothetical protein [Pseudonocardia sp.]|jgi:hypothetical protein|uniref:hypothetical protein n=1 Tax=Pseudonocardia sp. TaxID=60912 RepID=UPI0031FD727A
MSAPFEPGSALAWMEIDPDGLRVHRATVETIEHTAAGRWSVTTDHGTATVDGTGVGSVAVPLDPDIEADLYIYGDGYLVSPTSLGVEDSAQEDTSLERGDDLGFD